MESSINHGVLVVRRGKVLEITLDRSPANAINRAASYALYDAFKMLNDDPDLLVGIITGAGKMFSAGWDMKEFAGESEVADPSSLDLGPGGIGGLPEFEGLTKPVIAAVNGYCVGGAFECVMAADLIVASETAEFILPDIQLGFLPDAGGLQRLPSILPKQVAADLLYTGRRMGAAEAHRWGMVRDVVPTDQLMAKAREIADTIADGAPLAVQALKTVLNALEPLSVEERFVKTHQAWKGESDLTIYERMLRSEDYLEGPRAFAEKRKPVFKGA